MHRVPRIWVKQLPSLRCNSSSGNFNRHVLALVKLHQTSCKCRDARRHQQKRLHQKRHQYQRLHQKRHQRNRLHQKGKVPPKVCRCLLVSVQETNNFPISANSVTILKRNGCFSVPNLQLSFSIIHFPTQIMSRPLRCNGTWCSWQSSRKATASQFQSKSQS